MRPALSGESGDVHAKVFDVIMLLWLVLKPLASLRRLSAMSAIEIDEPIACVQPFAGRHKPKQNGFMAPH